MSVEITAIGSFSVRPDFYKKRFGESNRGTEAFLYDQQTPFFPEEERLTHYEIGEVEKWEPFMVDLLVGRGTSKVQKRFRECAQGLVDPRTSSEQIIVKLINQSLAMGGLYCSLGDESSDSFISVDNYPQNDVDELPLIILRDILHGLRAEMSLITCKLVRQYWGSTDYHLVKNPNHSNDDGEMEVISKDLALDLEDFARSGEDGWFYGDR